jgi:ubiquinone/menaquinone biosynthesis C-methylase UbiE
MLVSKDEVIKILRCPKTGSNLIKISSTYLQSSTPLNNYNYNVINGYPIVIDFENSVLQKETFLNQKATSPIERKNYNSILKLFKNLVSFTNKNTLNNIQKILEILQKNKSKRVLIIGGGSIGRGMEKFYQDSELELIAFDIYISDAVQFVADAHHIPLPDSYFDCVIIQAVLEHVLQPCQVVSEIHRVLKDDGIVYAETPFLQQVHEGAYDFTRFTESGHRYLFNQFKLIRSGVIAGAGTQLLWSIDFFFRGLFHSGKMGKLSKLIFFWLQYFDNWIPEEYAIDSASSVFFLGVKQDFPISPQEIIEHYQGSQ